MVIELFYCFFVNTLADKLVKVSIANTSLGLVELEETFSICKERGGCIIFNLGRLRNEKVADLTSSGGFLTRGISSRACWFDFLLILTGLRVLRIFTRIFSLIFPCYGAW
jgi:hypothetical protein